VAELFDSFNNDLHLGRHGKGIAFAFPISGANSFVAKLLTKEIQQDLSENTQGSDNKMASEVTHSFLVVIINQGYSEEAMTAAREAGAGGGTVLHARSLDLEETMKKWGISIQPEKEIIFILAEQEKKHKIMEDIGEKCGLHSDAQGIVVSFPVDAVTGLDKPLTGLRD
jgi:hypothetical protein